MDKKLSNKTELIRFLVYVTTWQISCPSPLPQKTLCGNQARNKDSSLMRLRGRERPEISLANNSIHGHLCVTALLQVQYTLCREGQMFRVEWYSPTSWECRRASTVTRLHHPHRLPRRLWLQPGNNSTDPQCNTGLKDNARLADAVFSTEEIMDGGLRNNCYMMTLNRKGLGEKKEGFQRWEG